MYFNRWTHSKLRGWITWIGVVTLRRVNFVTSEDGYHWVWEEGETVGTAMDVTRYCQLRNDGLVDSSFPSHLHIPWRLLSRWGAAISGCRITSWPYQLWWALFKPELYFPNSSVSDKILESKLIRVSALAKALFPDTQPAIPSFLVTHQDIWLWWKTFWDVSISTESSIF